MGGGGLIDSIDCAYLLLFPGWETSMRGNRWHWAKRWSALRPTTIVQPDGGSGVTLEPRMPGLRLLHMAQCDDRPFVEGGLHQAAAVIADMRRNGFVRPLLWSYNPHLAVAFGAIPAAGRIFHATENYFAYSGLEPEFLPRLRAALRSADLVIAVTDGVARGVRAEVETPTAVVTNGVDCRDYSNAEPDPVLTARGRDFDRLAIYAGNVNSRIDLDLLHECVHRFEDTLFAFYGRIWFPEAATAAAWENLIAHRNVQFFGEVDPDRLPALYAAADVGIIPYTDDPLLVENGFPLKVLEMAATGLPVVSTRMKPIIGLADGVVVTDRTRFGDALAATGRRTLAAEAAAELAQVCAANDYDVKFEEALAAVDAHLPAADLATQLDTAVTLDVAGWSDALVQYARVRAGSPVDSPLSARRLIRTVRGKTRH